MSKFTWKLTDHLLHSSRFHLIIFNFAIVFAIASLSWLAIHEMVHVNEIKNMTYHDIHQIEMHIKISRLNFIIIALTIIFLLFSWILLIFNRHKSSSLKTNEQQLEELLYYDHVNKLHASNIDSDSVPSAIKKLQLNRAAFISELEKAIKNNDFILYYQPIVNAQTGEITDVEALIRWKHPIQGLINPQFFLPLCETTGFIIPLGEWVLKAACKQIKKWHELGYRKLNISVNLSTRQLNHSQLLSLINETLKENNLSSNHLKLEITEDSLMNNIDASIALLKSLRKLGLHLSLDDFGTGYSYLKYIKQLPISNIKIDKSFIHDMTMNITSLGIVECIISLSKSLGLSITAEGVETENQLHLLKKLNCDSIQGYLYSKPVPAEELTELLKLYNTHTIASHDLLPNKNYQYVILNDSHAEQCVSLISKTFCLDEPMTKYLKISYDQFVPFAKLMVEKAIHDGLSMVALDNNLVVACTIVEDMADPLDININIDPKFNIIFSFLEHLGRDFFNERIVKKGHIAHLFITAVDKNYHGQGLSKKINFESICLAEKQGFDFMCCEFTHAYNEKGTLKNIENSRLLIHSSQYHEFIFEGKKPFENLSGHASAYIWELRDGAKLHYKINA